MRASDVRLTRRGMLHAGASAAVGIYLAGCGSSSDGSSGGSSGGGGGGGGSTLNWVTWNDHYMKDQLAAVEKATGIAARPTLQSDDSEGYLKLKQSSGQWSLISADALWFAKDNRDGLTTSFDIGEIAASSQLFSVAHAFPFWADGSKTMAYPFGWSTVNLYYDPKVVTTAPTSWEVLLDKRYQGKVVAENQPTDLMALGGIATGAKEPYDMSDDEIGRAKDFLQQAKPAFLKLVSQNDEVVRALADGSAVMGLANLGMDYRVKDAGGPDLEMATPKEGVFGFIDGEAPVKGSDERTIFRFLDAMEQADWIAKNFVVNGRPLFNEKAYKLLVDQGKQERADRLLYNQPEQALKMTLKGPSGNEQAYSDAFNEVFGA